MKRQTRLAAARAPRHPVPLAVNGAVLALDGDGVIWDCNCATETVLKYHRSELLGRHISILLPELRGSRLTRDGQLSPRLHLLCCSGRIFQAVARDGELFASELCLTRLGNAWSVEVQPQEGAFAKSPSLRRHRTWRVSADRCE